MKVMVCEQEDVDIQTEGTLFNSIKEFIRVSNFPKKLLLKKIDLLIEKKKIQVSKYESLIKSSKKFEENLDREIESLKRRNSKDVQDLIGFLS